MKILLNPFLENPYMLRALVCCLIFSVGFTAVGLFLVLRRMSLISDSMSHAIFPGVAIGYFAFGTSLAMMTLGGILAGVVVAFLSTVITRTTNQEEDASFASFYIISLALGVIIATLKGSNEELLHILFGDIISISTESLIISAIAATIVLLTVAIFYRAFIVEFVDSTYMKTSGRSGFIYHHIFLILVVITMVSSFRVLGTIMPVGLLLLPVMSARFWYNRIEPILATGFLISVISSYAGLLISYRYKIPAGPAIVMMCGGFYLVSVLLGSNNSIRKKYIKSSHLKS